MSAPLASLSAPEAAPPPPEAGPDKAQPTVLPADLAKVRVHIADSLKWTFLPAIIAIPLLIGVMLYMQGATSAKELATLDRMALAGSMQVGLGMYLGFICMYFGLMMTWLGIEAAYSVKLNAEVPQGTKADFALKSASPGLFFALLGATLIGVSLYKHIIYEPPGIIASQPDSVTSDGPPMMSVRDPKTGKVTNVNKSNAGNRTTPGK